VLRQFKSIPSPTDEKPSMNSVFSLPLCYPSLVWSVTAGTGLKFSGHTSIIKLYIQVVNTPYEVPDEFYQI
jgi:hypothetical protein